MFYRLLDIEVEFAQEREAGIQPEVLFYVEVGLEKADDFTPGKVLIVDLACVIAPLSQDLPQKPFFNIVFVPTYVKPL